MSIFGVTVLGEVRVVPTAVDRGGERVQGMWEGSSDRIGQRVKSS